MMSSVPHPFKKQTGTSTWNLALSVDEVGVAQVIQTSIAKDLSSNLEPHNLTEHDAALGQQLWVTHVEM